MKSMKKIVGTAIGLSICCILLTGVVFAPGPNTALSYEGLYVDLLRLGERAAPLQTGETRVSLIDTNTGLPAAAEMNMVRFAGEREHRVNVVRFNHNGAPVMLKFTNDIADGIAYQDQLAGSWCKPGTVWDTDPGLLREALDDYAAQVAAVTQT